MKKLKLALLSLLLVSVTAIPVFAGTYCLENVTQVITYDDGNIYFTTSVTCPNWCEITSTLTDPQKARHLSVLLSAIMGGKSILFYWVNLSSCTTNATYANPIILVLQK